MFGAQENRAVWDVPASATLLQCRGSLGEDGAILVCLDPRWTIAGDSCRAGRPGSLRLDGAAGAKQEAGQGRGRGRAGPGSRQGKCGGGAGGWQLPSSTKSLMLESAESSLSTRILLGRTACAASGLAGPLVHRHFFQHVSPGSWEAGHPGQRQGGSSHSLYTVKGTGWG